MIGYLTMWHPENLLYVKKGIQIDKGPHSRTVYLKDKLRSDGLAGIKENKYAVYCAVPLTSAPEELKPSIKKRQTTLLDILNEAALTTYDPSSAPYSPDLSLEIKPQEIYRVDKGKVVEARFFTLLDLLPSTGVGVEEETARDYNRIAVVLHDKAIRNSRMQPNRMIHLQYDNLEAQKEQLIEVFQFLQNFEPGMGFDNGVPVLLGFRGNKVVNLEKETYRIFPDLEYMYDGKKPIIRLTAENPEIFL